MKDINLRKDVDVIIDKLVEDINPYDSTLKCLDSIKLNSGNTILISIGKAAWSMAKAVADCLNINEGIVITKYNHSKGNIKNTKIFEAGHPIVDENSLIATSYALEITEGLSSEDNVIFCISGGGSALFEKPLIELEELQKINDQLIKSGADINEINIIRKRLSSVKAGKFALHCMPAHINAIILSDVVGNDLSTIASGPVSEDKYSIEDVLNVVNKYHLEINDEVKELLNIETPKYIDNVDTYIVGSVEQLCDYTKDVCESLNYKTTILQNNCKDNVIDIAKEFGKLIDANKDNHNLAFIIGGESVVEVKGNGLGGRNSELALRVSEYIKGFDNVCMFAFGSDGTDGPTDAAGGYVDGNTFNKINIYEYLDINDSYHALEKTEGLIKTGPTGSNVNDVYVLLIR